MRQYTIAAYRNASILWAAFDVWNTTARTPRDQRRRLVVHTKALIAEDRHSR